MSETFTCPHTTDGKKCTAEIPGDAGFVQTMGGGTVTGAGGKIPAGPAQRRRAKCPRCGKRVRRDGDGPWKIDE